MSGTDSENVMENSLARLEEVFDRRVHMSPLSALVDAIDGGSKTKLDIKRTAIGFDSSVFIRLATHRRSADILDYLPRHEAPLILPGQAVQEFWNNRLSVVDTISESLKKKFEALATDARRIATQFGDFETRMQGILDDFQSKYGYVYDEKTRESVSKTLSILNERAFCSFVSRSRFFQIAQSRKHTKTPPGFKDDGDGDFFVWADFLFGLLTCGTSRDGFEHVVLLTNDKKPDWSTAGVAHPLLVSEVATLFEAKFELWDLDRFASEVGKIL